jgi:hypothetical protein
MKGKYSLCFCAWLYLYIWSGLHERKIKANQECKISEIELGKFVVHTFRHVAFYWKAAFEILSNLHNF